ncbi:uncharacterized protein LOC105940134 isoform X1 [Fundulus heteroclitus]|uniref:uncharacterized protein LOC105940134 isoform X1 n=1 Tax=Fundulus heteroclitus TaxID=8078 RepID=UPI00165AD158|nr:uncharacterized protein LOC105940134 isoform X1 [Fundulus heteroclitus]XP_012738053.2 uncharacterized protein LOC105940134 isoform X1 [Fundulus heteroclitus]
MSPGVSAGQLQSPALAVQMEARPSVLHEKTPSSTAGTPAKSSFVIQTEEVRIECCATPGGLQLLHAREAAEMSRSFSQDRVQCRSLNQSGVLPDEGLALPTDPSEQELKVCPDILMVGTPNNGENTLSLVEPSNQMDLRTANEAEENRSDRELSVTSKSFHYKVVNVPFDQTYLDELRKMESAVWSGEETFMTSPVQNTFVTASNKTLNASLEANVQEMITSTEAPAEEIAPVAEMPPPAVAELEEMVPAGRSIEMSEGNICPAADDAPPSEPTNKAEITYILPLDNSLLESDREQHQLETTNDQERQDTSFESLPAYLPSTSWFSDFDHSYYGRKMPLAPLKQNRPVNLYNLDVSKRRRLLDMDYKEQPNIRKPKEGYKPRGKADRQSLSDHECCLSRNFENTLSSRRSRNERLCTRCTTKRRISTSPSSVCEGRSLKRKAAPIQQWNNVLLPTCEACKSHTNRQVVRKGSNPDLCSAHYGLDTEGDSSGNSSCWAGPKWRAADGSKLQDVKRPLAPRQMVAKSPVAVHAMLRERNCVHNDLQNQSVGRERLHHCPHGNTIREIDENCGAPVPLKERWRSLDQMYLTHRRQTAESWREATPSAYNGRFLKEANSQHLINHKKTQPLSQGTCTKETRC